MKSRFRGARVAIAMLIAALPLSFAVTTSQAHGGGGDGLGGLGGGSKVVVAGTVVSVDPSTNSFVANAYIVGEPESGPPPPYSFPGPTGQGQGQEDQDDQGSQEDQDDQGSQGDQGAEGGGHGGSGGSHHGDMRGVHMNHDGSAGTPTPTKVTITTDPKTTKFQINGKDGSISDLAAGEKFVAVFKGDRSQDIATLVKNNPAAGVIANSPPKAKQLYAFVGTVTAVDSGAGTLTVNVTNSVPSGLVPAASNPATFTIGSDTTVLGGSSGTGLSMGSLSNVSVGDVVAGALVAPAGQTLAQVQATPLRLLLDLPVPSGASSTTKAHTKAQALAKAKALLGYKDPPKPRKKHKKHK